MYDFARYTNNIEFTLDNSWPDISKILFWCDLNMKHHVLDRILEEIWGNIELERDVKKIFHLFSKKQNQFHFWIDRKTKRIKFYIWLYHDSLKTWLTYIKDIKDILSISAYS